MRYFNLDLEIDYGPTGRYGIRAESDPELALAGARESLALDAEDPILEAALERIDVRRTDARLLEKLGDELYERLLPGEVRELLDQCFGAMHVLEHVFRTPSGLRVRLRIMPPELASLPWELLHSPTRGFLATSVASPLVRYLDLRMPLRLLTTQFPLRVLVVIPGETKAAGAGAPLASNEEKAHLLQALEGVEARIRPTFLEGVVTVQSVHDALRNDRFHCLHFIGHGEFANERAHLLLNDATGGPSWADEAEVGSLFANHPTMKLVVLNSCHGATVSSTRPLVGMAPGLVRQGVPAVVAMQHRIADECAVAFAREFYHTLLRGPDKGRVDVAVCRARAALKDKAPGARDLASPVLFMRAPDGVLFDAESANPTQRGVSFLGSLYSRRETARVGALLRTHDADIRLLEEQHRTSGDPELLTALAQERQARTRLEQRIRFRNRIMTASAASLLLMFAFSFVRLFDWLGLDTTVESYTITLADPFQAGALRDEIILVTIGREIDPSWRNAHADLVTKLSQAGTRVIGFDFFFEEPQVPQAPSEGQEALERATERFAEAIAQARENGTSVIVGARAIGPDGPQLDARIAPALGLGSDPGHAGTFAGVGMLCLGRKLGQARTAPLVVEKADQRRYPSLALAAYAALTGAESFSLRWPEQRLVLSGPSGVSLLAFSETNQVEIGTAATPATRQACPAIADGDRVADLLIPLSPIEALRTPERQATYEDVLAEADEHELRDRFAGRVVLVGLRAERDSLPVFGRWQQERYGLELHADALDALLGGTVIRSAGAQMQVLVMAVLALTGGFIRYWAAPGRWTRRGLLLLVLFAYLASAIGAYLYGHVLLNTLYHVGALLLAYWLTGFVERRTYHDLRPRMAAIPGG